MTEAAGPADESPVAERHASWVELFFDLVVVAGVAQLAHLLHDGGSLSTIALYVLLYLAFWTAWAGITMYSNIAAERTRLAVVLAAMFGLAVMMASVAELEERHATAFALAYVLVRLLAARTWDRTQIVVDWPSAQLLGGVTPWIVSFWIDAPGKYWLWALGIAIDLLGMFALRENRLMESAQERMDKLAERGRERGRVMALPMMRAVHSDTPHLGERLGLFVIIVLGEGVIQVISSASSLEWDAALGQWAVGSFLLLIGIWALSLMFGFAGVPHLRPDGLPVRIAMSFHCITTCALAALAAGLGVVAAHPHDEPPSTVRWLLYGSAAAYFLIAGVAGLLTAASWKWLALFALPCTLAPLVLAALGDRVGIQWAVWVVALAVLWQLLYVQLRGRLDPVPT